MTLAFVEVLQMSCMGHVAQGDEGPDTMNTKIKARVQVHNAPQAPWAYVHPQYATLHGAGGPHTHSCMAGYPMREDWPVGCPMHVD